MKWFVTNQSHKIMSFFLFVLFWQIQEANILKWCMDKKIPSKLMKSCCACCFYPVIKALVYNFLFNFKYINFTS